MLSKSTTSKTLEDLTPTYAPTCNSQRSTTSSSQPSYPTNSPMSSHPSTSSLLCCTILKTGAEHSACESDIDHCPMLKINKNDKGEVTGLARFGENTVPSKGDARFVRSNYRFKAPEDGTLPDVPPKKSSLRPTPTPAPPPPLPPRPGMSPSPSPAGAPPLPPRPSVTTAM